jgi:hypothetical protein
MTDIKPPYTYQRHYYSISHIEASCHFARLSGEIENPYDGRFFSSVISPHNSYVTGCVLAAVAFLEATINEMFSDAAAEELGTSYGYGMDKEVKALLGGLWQIERFRIGARILEKYQVCLKTAQKLEFKPGELPFQDIRLLIDLRNALVHFKPEIIYWRETKPQEIENKLRGKFALNPFVAGSPSIPFFPSKCLGYGCALWAVKGSLAFTDEFFSRMSLEPVYKELRKFLIDYASMKSLDDLAAEYNVTVDVLVGP